MNKEVEFILYVSSQEKSKRFYADLLGKNPRLDVLGMTEFELSKGVILGLMPEAGIEKLLTGMPKPSEGNGIPRCELYLYTEDVQATENRAIKAGARLVNPAAKRNWGHIVSYVADPDGHIIAFASEDLQR